MMKDIHWIQTQLLKLLKPVKMKGRKNTNFIVEIFYHGNDFIYNRKTVRLTYDSIKVPRIINYIKH